MAKSPSINLFKGQEKSFTEKFINWALTIGRVIVILTEGIALIAFLYRFSLDRQLIDLHDKIKQKETIVKLLQKDEEKYRNLQDRIFIASDLGKKATALQKIFTEIINLAPPEMTVNDITLSTKNIRIDASFPSVQTLTAFVNSLRKHQAISAVSLDKIENKTVTAAILVGMTATLKESATK